MVAELARRKAHRRGGEEGRGTIGGGVDVEEGMVAVAMAGTRRRRRKWRQHRRGGGQGGGDEDEAVAASSAGGRRRRASRRNRQRGGRRGGDEEEGAEVWRRRGPWRCRGVDEGVATASARRGARRRGRERGRAGVGGDEEEGVAAWSLAWTRRVLAAGTRRGAWRRHRRGGGRGGDEEDGNDQPSLSPDLNDPFHVVSVAVRAYDSAELVPGVDADAFGLDEGGVAAVLCFGGRAVRGALEFATGVKLLDVVIDPQGMTPGIYPAGARRGRATARIRHAAREPVTRRARRQNAVRTARCSIGITTPSESQAAAVGCRCASRWGRVSGARCPSLPGVSRCGNPGQ